MLSDVFVYLLTSTCSFLSFVLFLFLVCSSWKRRLGPSSRLARTRGTSNAGAKCVRSLSTWAPSFFEVILRKLDYVRSSLYILAVSDISKATPTGIEPLRAEPNGFLVHIRSHSDKVF